MVRRTAASAALDKAGIAYVRIPELALRRNSPDPSPRPCWLNRGFRNYADHMRTDEFGEDIRALLAESRVGRTAVMCAEAVPCRCHRNLIADYLIVHKKRAVEELVGDRTIRVADATIVINEGCAEFLHLVT